MDDLNVNMDFLEKVYLPFIYLRHSIKSLDIYTYKLYDKDGVHEIVNENYFSNIMRIQKMARLYMDKCNK